MHSGRLVFSTNDGPSADEDIPQDASNALPRQSLHPILVIAHRQHRSRHSRRWRNGPREHSVRAAAQSQARGASEGRNSVPDRRRPVRSAGTRRKHEPRHSRTVAPKTRVARGDCEHGMSAYLSGIEALNLPAASDDPDRGDWHEPWTWWTPTYLGPDDRPYRAALWDPTGTSLARRARHGCATRARRWPSSSTRAPATANPCTPRPSRRRSSTSRGTHSTKGTSRPTGAQRRGG